MKTLYLHAGIHKTGSTSLQGTFHLSAEILQSFGIRYVGTGRSGGAHHQLAREIRGKTKPGARMGEAILWQGALAEVEECSESIVVISSENFDSFGPRDVEKLNEVIRCSAIDCRVRVVFYLRSQATLLSSQYSQQIRVGFRRESFRDFVSAVLDHEPRWLRFRRLLEPWMEVFGRDAVIVRIAEPKYLIDGSVRDDFLSLIDKPGAAGQLRGPDWRNSSLNADALAGIRDVLNTEHMWSIPFEERRKLLTEFFKEELQKPELRGVEVGVFGRCEPPIELVARCREHFAGDNRWLADSFFGGRDLIDECYENEMAGCAGHDECDAGGTPETRQNIRVWLSEFLSRKGYAGVAGELGGE